MTVLLTPLAPTSETASTTAEKSATLTSNGENTGDGQEFERYLQEAKNPVDPNKPESETHSAEGEAEPGSIPKAGNEQTKIVSLVEGERDTAQEPIGLDLNAEDQSHTVITGEHPDTAKPAENLLKQPTRGEEMIKTDESLSLNVSSDVSLDEEEVSGEFDEYFDDKDDVDNPNIEVEQLNPKPIASSGSTPLIKHSEQIEEHQDSMAVDDKSDNSEFINETDNNLLVEGEKLEQNSSDADENSESGFSGKILTQPVTAENQPPTGSLKVDESAVASLHRPYRFQQPPELPQTSLTPSIGSTSSLSKSDTVNELNNSLLREVVKGATKSIPEGQVASERMISTLNQPAPKADLPLSGQTALGNGENILGNGTKPADSIMEKVANFNLGQGQGRELSVPQDTKLNHNLQVPLYDASNLAGEWRGVKGPVQMPVNIQFGQPQWANMVAERSAMMLSQKIDFAELQLDPPELGPLQVKVNVQQDQATVQFVTANAQVREALEHTSSRLRELLEQESMDLVNVDVSDQSDTSGDHQESDALAESAVSDDLEENVIETSTSSIEASYGVNYYV